MWHYTEGIQNWDPIWPRHGIRILPGPSSLWLDAHRPPAARALLPGLRHARHAARTCARRGYDHSWFVLTQTIIEKEFALSGSEQNPDLTGRDVRLLLSRLRARARRARRGVQGPRRGLRVADTLRGAGGRHEPARRRAAVTRAAIARGREARDREIAQPVRQGRAGHGAPGRAALPRRPADARRAAAPAARPEGRAADRGAAAHPDAQDARRPGHRPRRRRVLRRGRRAAARALRGGRGRRVRRRRHARLQRRSRAPSWAAACSRAGSPVGPRLLRASEPTGILDPCADAMPRSGRRRTSPTRSPSRPRTSPTTPGLPPSWNLAPDRSGAHGRGTPRPTTRRAGGRCAWPAGGWSPVGERPLDRVPHDQRPGRDGHDEAGVPQGPASRRCLVPAEGYYEWQGAGGPRTARTAPAASNRKSRTGSIAPTAHRSPSRACTSSGATAPARTTTRCAGWYHDHRHRRCPHRRPRHRRSTTGGPSSLPRTSGRPGWTRR